MVAQGHGLWCAVCWVSAFAAPSGHCVLGKTVVGRACLGTRGPERPLEITASGFACPARSSRYSEPRAATYHHLETVAFQ
jgi:hypothetical protein